MTTTAAPRTALDLKPGDVIEDAYGNAAVVLSVRVGMPGRTANIGIMQTAGSDRGRHASRTFRTDQEDRFLVRITDNRAEAAREVARAEWRAGRRW
jgi:translation elongation factor P/translation initiation factor 5A